MILIKDLYVSYFKKKSVLDGLNIQLENNCIHGIVGLNGAGKTTLLNSIFGIKDIEKGDVLFENRKISKKDISYLPGENYFYPNISGREYLNIFRNKEFDTNRWNKLFSLPLDDVIETYSTGMKKKLALFGMLKNDKPILILDEPFNGLDIETGRIIRAILLKLRNRGKTILITSHIIETLTNMCDYIHLLENGKITLSVDKNKFEEFEDRIFKSIESKNDELINSLIKE